MRVENLDGERHDLDDVLDEYLPGDVAEQSLVCSDMDGTMFENDIGLLVFLEKLSDPSLWYHSPDRFARILIPNKYYKLLQEGARGDNSFLNKEDCWMALQLHLDIVNLYKLRRKKMRGGKNGDLDIHSPLINEFAYKMMALDAIMVKLDRIFMQSFDGQLLLRTRHFAAKRRDQVYQLVNRVMARTEESEDSVVSLGTHDENAEEADQLVSEEQVRIYGFEPVQDRVVREVDDVRRIIARLLYQQNASGRVVSTNLDLIVKAALRSSNYSKLFKSRDVVATTQYRDSASDNNEYRLQARVNDKPVFGAKKAELADKIAGSRRLQLRAALGDSAGNDGPMLERALINEGIAVLVGQSREQIERSFERIIDNVSDLPDVNKRILLVTTHE